MAVKIRMKRLGSHKRPFYRIVVADSRRARNGRFIEEIGYYNPISEPRMFRIDADKVKQWISNGAKPTDTVSRLFREYSVLDTEGVVSVGVNEKKEEKKVEPVKEESSKENESEEVEETKEVEAEETETEETEEETEA